MQKNMEIYEENTSNNAGKCLLEILERKKEIHEN